MTAAMIVALAQRVATWVFTTERDPRKGTARDYLGDWLDVDGMESFALGCPDYSRKPQHIMAVVLTPENTASEHALARALVATRVQELTGEPLGSDYRFVLGKDQGAHASSRDALLDALLGAPEAVG
jgi:hypothetical protein